VTHHAGVISVIVAALSACVGPGPTESDTAEIRGGELTCARPEVGKLRDAAGFCTATLVSPTTVLTAAHCYDYESGPAVGTFRMELCDGTVVEPATDWALTLPFSVGMPFGHADAAVVRLTSPVSHADIAPAPIATVGRYLGEEMTIYGYGCGDWEGGGSGQKRRQTLRWGLPHWQTCEGDSGGPIFDSLGDISLLTSWGAPSEWVPVDDAYADAVRHRDALLGLVAALEAP
jgi:hypothetical protein